ncbi:MAG TPA: histidine kinase, partial [Saprospiraceae bacterium]|nr:histidine kinase [Saprospiraceae bacterium]
LFNSSGKMFVATYGAGLLAYNGNSLSTIILDGSEQMKDIYDALLDDNGQLWMGTDHGIWIYSPTPPALLQNLGRKEGMIDEIITELETSADGNIWIGFYDHGFGKYVLSKNQTQSTFMISPEDGNVVQVVRGNRNEIWLATGKQIIRHTEDVSGKRIQLPMQLKDNIEDVLFDRTGNLWIAAGNKLFMTNTQLELRIPGLKGIQAITSLDNKLWIGCEQGLYSLDLGNDQLTQHLKNEQLNILSLYHDKQGMLWIGTFGQGLYIMNPGSEKFLHMTEDNNISNNSILNIDGINNSLLQREPVDEGLPYHSNTVWLATLGGITEINWSGNVLTTKPIISLFKDKFNFPAGYVYDVHVSNEKKIWFGTDGKGLYLFDRQKLHAYTKPVETFKNDSIDLRTIYSITSDAQNNIWVSATKGNILKLDGNGNITDHIFTPYGSLNSLATSGNDEIIMVREGVIQIKSPKSGNTVISAATGLNTFAPNINSTAVHHDGSVWIADTDKILHYQPMAYDTSQYVHMHMVDVTPGKIYQTESIRLKPDSNYLDFRFTGLWYPDPQSVRYRYKLEGHDPDWIYTQEGRAVYSKLSPGDYTFIVAGSHDGDFTHSVPIRQLITVLPPFYFTWWFILGCIFLISFLTYRYMRERISRVNRFHQLEKEKTTLQLHAIQAQVNPHFLFNSFNTLSGIIEEDQEAAVDYVDQLSAFFRGVLQHRNSELITLAEEIEIMRNYTYILKKRYGDNIVIVENISSNEGFIAPLTLQMLVENAIKHNIVSNEKPLRITITIDDEWVQVVNPVKPKFQSMTESTGFGLSSLLTRYKYLTKRMIEIQHDKDIFSVRIPIIHFKPAL